MQSPSIYLDESQSLENLTKDIKSDPKPNIFQSCESSIMFPLSLEEARSFDFSQDKINKADNILLTDLFDSHMPSLLRHLSNQFKNPYPRTCNIEPFQNIAQYEQSGLIDLTMARVVDVQNGDENEDKKSLIDELICLLAPSDENVLIFKNNSLQKQPITSQVKVFQEKGSSNQLQKTGKIQFFEYEEYLVEESMNKTNTLKSSNEMIDDIGEDQLVREGIYFFQGATKKKKRNVKYQIKRNKPIKIEQQAEKIKIGISKKQTIMIKKLRKSITNTISVVQKRAIIHKKEDNYEYCWVFGSISCWFSLNSLSILNDLWLCWANSQINQKVPFTQTLQRGNYFNDLLERIQSKQEMDPRVKIKGQLKFEQYLNSTKAVFAQIAMNKVLQFNKISNRKKEAKQESEEPKGNLHELENVLRKSKKKLKKMIDMISKSQECHKQQQIYHQ